MTELLRPETPESGAKEEYVIAETASVIQVVAMGPLEFTYVDPRDDPRNADAAAPTRNG